MTEPEVGGLPGSSPLPAVVARRIGAPLAALALLLRAMADGPNAAAEAEVAPEPGAAAGAQTGAGEYMLEVGDLVEVSVFGHRDTIADNVPIAPDGRLYYMFIPGVPAAGRSPDEVAADIESRIGHLFNSPRVVVLPKVFSANTYRIHGKVVRPGVYALNRRMTLREAVAHAGGLAQGVYRGSTIEVASLATSYIARRGSRLPVDFRRLILDGDAAQDVVIEPGDVIYIASGLSGHSEVYLLGAVAEQKAVAYADGLTLTGVLAGSSERGGGYLDSAHLDRVLILRGSLAQPQVIEVNLRRILWGRATDPFLAPGDIVYVPERPYRFAGEVVKDALLIFVRTFASEAAADLVLTHILPPDDDDGSGSGSGSASEAQRAIVIE